MMRDAQCWHEGSRVWLAAPVRDGGGPFYEEQMLAGMQTAAFLPFQVRYQDEQKYYLYDITGKTALSSYIEKTLISYVRMMQMIRSVMGVFEAAEEYLLDINAVLTDPACIYVDLTDPQLGFIYLPGYAGDFLTGIRGFAADLLARADHRDQDCVLLVYDFFRIVQEDDFCPAALKRFAEEEMQPVVFSGQGAVKAAPDPLPLFDEDQMPVQEEKEPEETPPARRFKLCGFVLPAAFAAVCITAGVLWYTGVLDRLCAQCGIPADSRIIALAGILASGLVIGLAAFLQNRRGEKLPAAVQDMDDPAVWFHEDTEDDATVYLKPEAAVLFKRLDAPGAGDLAVDMLPAVLGSSPEADLRLEEKGVSRRHAVISREGGELCIRDAGSTNGTFVNGRRLAGDETAFLRPGDVITLAKVRLKYTEYQFL